MNPAQRQGRTDPKVKKGAGTTKGGGKNEERVISGGLSKRCCDGSYRQKGKRKRTQELTRTSWAHESIRNPGGTIHGEESTRAKREGAHLSRGQEVCRHL